MLKSQLGLHINHSVWDSSTLHFPQFFGFQQFVCSNVKAKLQPGYMLQLLLEKINQNVIRLKNIQIMRKLSWRASIPLLRFQAQLELTLMMCLSDRSTFWRA